MRNQWRGVNLARLNQAQNLLAIADVHVARLEGQILAVHLGQWQHLRLIVERHNRYNRIWASTLPRQAEGILRTRNLQHHIGTSTLAFFAHRGDAILRCDNFHARIVFTHKTGSFGRFFANNDMLRLFQHHAQQRANSRWASTDNQHRIVWLNLGDGAAQNPVANTSPTNNACSSLTLSGMRLRPWSAYGTRTYSAWPPSMRQPSAQPPLGSVQLFTKPFLQKKHSPQKVSTLTVTRSPALTLRTSEPTSSTTPTISWPTVMPGTARGTLPCLICRSLVQILPSVMRTMASRGLCNSGFGLSISSNLPGDILGVGEHIR